MPTIFRQKGYRFFFYSNDHTPPHIHVEKGRSTAKYLLNDATLVVSRRFNSNELGEMRKIILENLSLFKHKWDEYFKD
jgi:hypothetical protein